MKRERNNRPPDGLRARAFTLVEVVVALTIIAVIAAIAVPTLQGLDRDEKARAPVRALAELVQEVRHRAMKEHRAWQIVFESQGIHACPGSFPFTKREDFLKFLDELRTPRRGEEINRGEAERLAVEHQEITGAVPSSQAGPAPQKQIARPVELPWTASIGLEPKTQCEVLLWGDGEWDHIEGSELRRWVIQSSGMVSPARVRWRTAAVELEAGFDALTGELIGERTMHSNSQR